jgi:hypothetical protein
MDEEFKVVTDTAVIARLNKKLASRVRETFKHSETREVSYPSGHQTRKVFFEKNSGGHVRAWAPIKLDDKLGNFLLYGEPKASNWMEIAVQLNFPAGKYNRMMAGAFVTDSHGDAFIAHRGKLTKGRAGLPKEAVFREFSPSLVEASDGAKTSKLILIAALDDRHLVDYLFDFATEAREVATRLGIANKEKTSEKSTTTSQRIGNIASVKSAKSKPEIEQQRLLKLRSYFDEYAGEGRSKGHGGGKRTVEHGAIVKALEAILRSKGQSQKAQAIDLAIVSQNAVSLFEVKTSAQTTDVYTGVGQLFIHGECIAEVLNLPVHRHLVLPCKPNEAHAKHIVGKGAMNIVTFTKANGLYSFSNL